MRSKKIQLWSILLFTIFFVTTTNSEATPVSTTIFEDGQIHNIDYDIFEVDGNQDVWVKNSSSGQSTTVNLLFGGSIKNSLSAYENSEVNIAGGSIGWNLGAYDNSLVNVIDGTMDDMAVFDNSQVYISGGRILNLRMYNSSQAEVSCGIIDGYLHSEGNSRVYIYGGHIEDEIKLTDEGIVTIYGSDFVLNGVTVDAGTFGADEGGLLTGVFANGDPIYNMINFYSDYSQLVLIPEPTTLLLLALGSVILRKRYKSSMRTSIWNR